MRIIYGIVRGNVYYRSLDNLDAVLDIMKNDRVKLAPAIGTPSDFEINKGKYYYLSMSRVLSSGWLKSSKNVMMLLDRDYLTHRYKIIPVDYWGPFWNRNPAIPYTDRQTFDETEDRLVHDKPWIPATCVKEFHIQTHHWMFRDAPGSVVYYIDDWSSRSKIPVYWYLDTDEKNYKVLNTQNAYRKLSDLIKDKGIKLEYDTYPDLHERRSYYEDEFLAVADMLNQDIPRDELTESQWKVLDGMRYEGSGGSLSSAVHNTKMTYNKGSFEALTKMIEAMNRKKIRTLKDLAKYLIDKYLKRGN